jgi:hypothetical protein
VGFHLNSSRRAVAIWTTVAAFLGFAILQPSAYGLEFSATTTLTLPASDQLDALTGEVFLTSMTDPEIAPIEAALFRSESRGGHHRTDAPAAQVFWQRHTDQRQHQPPSTSPLL